MQHGRVQGRGISSDRRDIIVQEAVSLCFCVRSECLATPFRRRGPGSSSITNTQVGARSAYLGEQSAQFGNIAEQEEAKDALQGGKGHVEEAQTLRFCLTNARMSTAPCAMTTTSLGSVLSFLSAAPLPCPSPTLSRH
eukprot:751339-Hanusia_phi.AAC.1